MATEKKHLFGGMNFDDHARMLPKGDWRSARNVRAGTTNDGNDGAIENFGGNSQAGFQNQHAAASISPSTDLKVIGSCNDKIGNKVYYFVIDNGSAPFCGIFVYDHNTSIATWVDYSTLFNFDEKYPITGVILIDQKYLYWTDGSNEPSKIDITKDWGNLSYGVTRQSYDIIPWAPLAAPTVQYSTDTTYVTNSLRGKLFQFKSRYIYDDYRKSAWSPISKVPLPFEGAYFNEDTQTNNTLEVIVPDTGYGEVKRIQVAMREGNLGNFKVIEDVDVNENAVVGTGASYTFNWRNDVPTSSVQVDDSNLLFSEVPHKATSLEISDGNRLMLGNITEGYDFEIPSGSTFQADAAYTNTQPDPKERIIIPGISVSPGEFTWEAVRDTLNGFTTETITGVGDIITFSDNPSTVAVIIDVILTNKTDLTGLANPGPAQNTDIPITLNIPAGASAELQADIFESALLFSALPPLFESSVSVLPASPEYGVYLRGGSTSSVKRNILFNAQDVVRQQLTLGFADELGLGEKIQRGDNGLPQRTTIQRKASLESYNIAFLGSRLTVKSVNIVYPTNGYNGEKQVTSYKRGATHKFGIAYQDDRGRMSPVYTSEGMTEKVPWDTGTLRGAVEMVISISFKPPIWARKYQIVYAGNRTILQDPAEGRGFIQYVATGSDHGESSLDKTGWISLNNIANFGYIFNDSELTYGYTKGDRMRIRDRSNSPSTQYFDVEIESFDPITNRIYFNIENYTNFKSSTSLFEYFLFEIYTPADGNVRNIYTEVGESQFIANPGTASRSHNGNVYNQNATATSSAITRIKGGDVYMKNRRMFLGETDYATSIVELVEESHYCDYYRSNYTNVGRPSIENKEYREINRETAIRYSDVYIPDTNINGFGTFYTNAYSEYDKSYGPIKKLYNENKRLICFQQLKVGAIFTNESTLQDNQGQVLVQKSSEILGDIQYYAGEYGMTHPESFAVFGFQKYFVDARRGTVCRLSIDGITPISDVKMKSYFEEKMPFYGSEIQGGRSYIRGVYDEQYNSYILAFGDVYSDIGYVPLPPTYIPNPGNPDNYRLTSSGFTIVWNEKSNRWTSFLDFKPDWMETVGNTFVSFNGSTSAPWIHNSVGRNSYFGTVYSSDITVVVGVESPSVNKVWNNLSLEGTALWPNVLITNDLGQSSSLIEQDFERIEDRWYAALWKDENTPNVSNPLFEGDDVRSPYIYVKITSEVTGSPLNIFSIGMGNNASFNNVV